MKIDKNKCIDVFNKMKKILSEKKGQKSVEATNFLIENTLKTKSTKSIHAEYSKIIHVIREEFGIDGYLEGEGIYADLNPVFSEVMVLMFGDHTDDKQTKEYQYYKVKDTSSECSIIGAKLPIDGFLKAFSLQASTTLGNTLVHRQKGEWTYLMVSGDHDKHPHSEKERYFIFSSESTGGWSQIVVMNGNEEEHKLNWGIDYSAEAGEDVHEQEIENARYHVRKNGHLVLYYGGCDTNPLRGKSIDEIIDGFCKRMKIIVVGDEEFLNLDAADTKITVGGLS